MNACEYHAQTLDSRLQNPDRKHDAQGIGEMVNIVTNSSPVISSEVVSLALEFIADLCSPDSYGHALPAEVVARAGRIRAMLRPKPTGVGYTEPPAPRCQHCDES